MKVGIQIHKQDNAQNCKNSAKIQGTYQRKDGN